MNEVFNEEELDLLRSNSKKHITIFKSSFDFDEMEEAIQEGDLTFEEFGIIMWNVLRDQIDGQLLDMSKESRYVRSIYRSIKQGCIQADQKWLTDRANGNKGGRPPKKPENKPPDKNPDKSQQNPDKTQSNPDKTQNNQNRIDSNGLEGNRLENNGCAANRPSLDEVRGYFFEHGYNMDVTSFYEACEADNWHLVTSSGKPTNWKRKADLMMLMR